MSNALAIAGVTATLRHLLDRGLNAAIPGVVVSTRPPDKARDNCRGNQLNLFLYSTTPNAAWRNIDVPRPDSAASRPLLALNLHYLLSVYGQDDDDAEPYSHRLLGEAMRILQDHSVLEPAALQAALPGCDLHLQAERVRITQEPMALDEMSKLWTTFHSVERTFGRFERTVTLPAEVDSKQAEATFKDGVLSISLPKLKPVAAQKITVKPAT